MKEKTIKTYKFKELSEEIQDKLINEEIEFNSDVYDCDWLIEDFINEVKEKLKINLEEKDIIYSIGGRDGHFGVLSDNLSIQLDNKHSTEECYMVDIDFPNKIGAFLSHRGGGICMLNNTEEDMANVDFEDTDISDEPTLLLIGKKRLQIEENVKQDVNDIIEMCNTYFNKLNRDYEDVISEEYAKDGLIDKDEDYNENGDIV